MMKRTLISLIFYQAISLSMMVHAEEITSDSSALSLDEMVVTTRKREEMLQEIPVAITSFSAELINDADLQNIEDIAMLTPGFTFTQLFGYVGNPVIRGASTTIGEPNVGFFLDGVYQNSRTAMEAMFGDELERIEIAKGPQSALYGRNSFSGTVNYVTKQPSNDNEGRLEVTIGNEGRKDARLSYSGAITEDTLFYRVGAMHSGFDGFYKNDFDGSDLDDKQSNIYSLSLVALPTDELEMVFRIGVENTNDGDDPVQFVDNNAAPLNLGPFGIYNELLTGDVPSLTNGFNVMPGHNERDSVSSSFRLDWDLEQVTFTSISGYNDLELDLARDTDYSSVNNEFTNQQVDQEEFSQEFRLTSVGQPIRWMAGVYFYDLNRDNVVTSPTVSISEENTRNWAGFGSIAFDLTDQLSLTLEGRYSYERKELMAIEAAIVDFDGSQTFNNFMPKVALDYQFSDDSMIYASVAKAVKSGGFNLTINAAPLADERRYDEEKSLNYEIGLKSSWLDNRLTTNLAVFYIDWTDQIVRSLGSTGALLNDNAGESSSRGFELEVAAKPAKNWDVTAGLSYTDAQYDSYTFDAIAPIGLETNLDGNRMQFVSEWTANTSVQYVRPSAIAGFDWKSRVDVMYQSDQKIQAVDDIGTLPSRTIVNFRTTLENEKYSASLWVKNLFDDDSALGAVVIHDPAGSLFVGFNGLVQAPAERSFGVTASLKF